MSDVDPTIGQETSTIELRVYRDGELVLSELHETFDDANAAAEQWTDVEGVRFEINDLSFRHASDEERAEPSDLDEAYEHDVE